MKILVTGGSGVIGSKFVNLLSENQNEVLYTYLSRDAPVDGGRPEMLDITDRDSVMGLVKKFEPEIIIHCSALTDADLCETNPELGNRINVEGTRNVLEAGKKSGSKFVFISTAHVFYDSKKVFTEEDKPKPINKYGVSKVMAEDVVKKSGVPFLILRTDHPYRWSPAHLKKNNVMRVITLLEKKEKFREASDWYNMPTLVDNFVEVAYKLIKKWEDGIYHTIGPDYINRYDFAAKVADAMGADKSLIQKIKFSDLPLAAKRPNIKMSNDKVEKKTGMKMVGVDEGINIVMKQRESYLKSKDS